MGYRVMAFMFRVRDFLRPRRDIVREAGIENGFRVLDFGCGPGSYVAVVSELVGASGKLYALDVNPLAIEMVRRLVVRKRLLNVETILSGRSTGLPDGSVDVVLLYDTFHDLSDPVAVLEELHRVLKSNGTLSFSDHHMREDEIKSKLTKNGFFRLLRRGERTYTFVKEEMR